MNVANDVLGMAFNDRSTVMAPVRGWKFTSSTVAPLILLFLRPDDAAENESFEAVKASIPVVFE